MANKDEKKRCCLNDAAADMLAALEELDRVETLADHDAAESGDWMVAMTAVRSAIAKAKGV